MSINPDGIVRMVSALAGALDDALEIAAEAAALAAPAEQEDLKRRVVEALAERRSGHAEFQRRMDQRIAEAGGNG